MKKLLIPLVIVVVFGQHVLESVFGIPCGGASHLWAISLVPALATWHWWPWRHNCSVHGSACCGGSPENAEQ